MRDKFAASSRSYRLSTPAINVTLNRVKGLVFVTVPEEKP